MYTVMVMYPNQEGGKFDIDYYRSVHMPLVEKHLKHFGLTAWEVLEGISGTGNDPAPYLGVGILYFESEDGYNQGVSEKAVILRGDIPNFTNVTPVRLLSRVITERKSV